jgi:PEGA domain
MCEPTPTVRITFVLAVLFSLSLCGMPASEAQNQNSIMGQVTFAPATKVEKNAGVWVDGEYVGFVSELKEDKKVLLLPGEHEIAVRQSGYKDFIQKIVVEPGKEVTLAIKMERDPAAQFSSVNAEVKLKVTPDRAAVFVDNAFAGYVHEFGGLGRAMLLAPGKHQIKIALPGYKDFVGDINLRPNEKYTIKTDLLPGSITEADKSIKKN